MPSPAESSGAAEGEDPGPPFRDREPPPYFDGEDPAKNFKPWLRELELWAFDTEVPAAKHGTRILRRLGGAAKAAANELETSEILGEKGKDNILAKLKEYFSPHLETTMPKAFEKAVYGEIRGIRESLSEYIIRMDAAFRELKNEGVDLPSEARGYVMYRQARLSSVQEDQLTTWTEGKFSRDVVIKALRKLDKVREQPGGAKRATYFDEGGTEDGEAEDDSDFDEDYVYLEQADLQDIYEESEVKQALATYQQVRRALQDQKNNREYFPLEKGKGKGKKGNYSSGARVHVSMLKLRTKCAKCGQVGHWAAECPNPADGYHKQGASSTGSAASSQAGHSSSAKSGFYQVSGDVGSNAFFGKKPLLGSFLRATRDSSQGLVVEGRSCDIREQSPEVHPQTTFSGVTTQAHHGIVDSAAQDGVIGKLALERLEQDLRSRGLKPRWCNRVVRTKGIGGEAKSLGVCELPLGIGGVSGILETAVVEGEVPLLLPVKLLKQLRSVINLDEECLELRSIGAVVPMNPLPSGHYTIEVTDFAGKDWHLPTAAAQAGRRESEFRCEPRFESANSSFGGFAERAGIDHEPASSAAVRAIFVASQDGPRKRPQPKESIGKLASGVRQAHRPHRAVHHAGTHGGLVQRVIVACLAAFCGGTNCVGASHAERAEQTHRGQDSGLQAVDFLGSGKGAPASEVQSASSGEDRGVWPCRGASPWCGERAQQRRLLHPVQWQVGRERHGRVHRGDDPHADRRGEGTSSHRCPNVPLRRGCGEVGHQEARADPRPAFLEVRRSCVPVLRLGPRRDGQAARGEAQGDGGPGAVHRGAPAAVAAEPGPVRAGDAGTESAIRDGHGAVAAACGRERGDGEPQLEEQGPDQDGDGPSCGVALDSPLLRKKWRALQLEEKVSRGRARVVSEGYWWKDPAASGVVSDEWHFATGIVPEFSECAWVRGVFHQDFHGNDGTTQLEPKTLSRQKRKKIIRAFPRPLACGGGSVDSGFPLEPEWCWHEFRCSSAPCAVFVVQLLDPGETFRWESVVLGGKRALILYVGPAGREVGCDWYRWQSECGGDVAMLVQDSAGNHEENVIYFHAKGARDALRDVWESLSCSSSPLCGAVIRWTFGDENAEALGHSFPQEAVEEIDGEAEEIEPEEGTAEAPDLALAGELTAHQKAMVKRMHDNMGHPDKLTFLRTVRRARASPAVQKYIKEKFECEACQSRPLPKPSRPATVVRGYRPGVIVGVDVLFLPDVDPRQLKPVLNIVDWGSGYQALEPMREKTASEAFRKFWKAWGRHFGSPEVMVTDAGTEFGKEFCELAAGRGIVTRRQIGSRAPWQQGITERQGGLAKLLFERVRDEVCPTNKRGVGHGASGNRGGEEQALPPERVHPSTAASGTKPSSPRLLDERRLPRC